MTGSNDSLLSESALPLSGPQSPAPALTPDTGSTVTGFSAFLYFCFLFEIYLYFIFRQSDRPGVYHLRLSRDLAGK